MINSERTGPPLNAMRHGWCCRRIEELEVQNGQLAGYLSTSEDKMHRYRKALEQIWKYGPCVGEGCPMCIAKAALVSSTNTGEK